MLFLAFETGSHTGPFNTISLYNWVEFPQHLNALPTRPPTPLSPSSPLCPQARGGCVWKSTYNVVLGRRGDCSFVTSKVRLHVFIKNFNLLNDSNNLESGVA
ncbi:hypothetical protein ILYODFUR_025588 [Ilyodon furcidens]|uniref:Uncharacterized protein n=1 Tax=Ilyodon furcidens TaxID=33524 RepID=A0ABV0TEG8_9TELE